MELDDITHEAIKTLSNKADELFDEANYKDALEVYREAFELVPVPKTDWEASTWLLTAILDTYYYAKSYEAAKDIADYVMHCPDAIGNPYIHLRAGAVHFELGDMESASDEFTRAYGLEGEKIFDDEPPRFLEFLRTKISM